MEYFEIGCCFKSYQELTEKLSQYCSETYTKFTTKDCRLIKDEFAENNEAKTRLIYTELKIICVHGRTSRPRNSEPRRKRTITNIPTGCPAYFRLKLIQSGVALQIVALNVKHNHPLEPPKDGEFELGIRKKKQRGAKIKAEKKFKEEIKSDDDSASDNEQDYVDSYADGDNSEDSDLCFNLKGFCAPVFTPFSTDMSLNTDEVPKYAKYLSDNGIRAVLVNSIIGEGTLLNVEERKLIVEAWHVAIKTTKQHLMVQIGGCPLTNVLDLVKHAEHLNVNSLLCLPDLYFKPKTTESLVDYLKIVSQAAPKTPLFYYHDPQTTGVDIDMKEFVNEANEKIPTFRGIYHCASNLDSIIDIVNTENRKCSIFFGADRLLAGAFVLGFDSAIVAFVNLFPEYCLEILRAVNDSDLSKARKVQSKLCEAYLQITRYGNSIATMKCFMNIITKINVGPPRPPLTSLTEDQINDIKTHMSFS